MNIKQLSLITGKSELTLREGAKLANIHLSRHIKTRTLQSGLTRFIRRFYETTMTTKRKYNPDWRYFLTWERLIAIIITIGMILITRYVMNARKEIPEPIIEVTPVVEEVIEEVIEDEPLLLYEVPLDDETQKLIIEIAEKSENLTPELILAVIETESSFREDAISWVGAYGYMQIMPEYVPYYCKKYGVPDIYGNNNIIVGCGILDDYIGRYGLPKGLLCYNAGEAGANAYYFQKGITETEYSKVVQRRMERGYDTRTEDSELD